MSKPVRSRENAKRAVAGRPRVVALIVAVSAMGMVLLLVAMSFVLRWKAAEDIELAVEQEASEVQRFAKNGVDPATGQPFASGARFAEVFLERQQAEPTELLIGGVIGKEGDDGVLEQSGSQALSYRDLDDVARTQVRAPGSKGTTTISGVGTITWHNVVVETPQDDGFVSVVAYHVPYEDDTRGQLMVLAVLAALALAATGLAAWWAAGLVLAHTREFQVAVDSAVERRGVPRLSEEGSPEYAQLASAANRLVERAENLVEEQYQHTEDITHELRSPMAMLEGGLSQPGQTPEQIEHTRGELLAEVRRLRLFITDLVTMNRAQRAGYVRPATIANAIDLAGEAVSEWEDRRVAAGETDKNGVRVLLGECDEGLLALVDPPRIQQALDALIANARKASESGSWITISARRITDPEGETMVSLQVADAGRGIPKKERTLVKRRFARASNDPNPGAGMGIPLAVLLAESHGGKLQIRDNGEYPGMTVSIDLPLHVLGSPNGH